LDPNLNRAISTGQRTPPVAVKTCGVGVAVTVGVGFTVFEGVGVGFTVLVGPGAGFTVFFGVAFGVADLVVTSFGFLFLLPTTFGDALVLVGVPTADFDAATAGTAGELCVTGATDCVPPKV